MASRFYQLSCFSAFTTALRLLRKRGHIFTQDASRSGLCMTLCAMMRVSGRRQGHISVTFVQSETSAVTGAAVIGAQLGKGIGVASQCQRNNIIAKGKKADSNIIDRFFMFEIKQCMIHPILLAGKHFDNPAVLALSSSYTFF